MSYIRTIKPEFFRSESLSKLSVHARLMFAGLWTEADGSGRGVANAKVLKGTIWPCDDNVTDKDVEQYLKSLDRTGHITLYEVDGKRYFQVLRWDVHQSAAFRRGGSRLPPPPDVQETPQLPLASVQTKRRDSGKTSAPDKFVITDELRQWSYKSGFSSKVDLDHQTDLFMDYHVAKGNKFVDWNRAWQVWIRRSVEYAGQRGSSSRGSSTSSMRQRNETVSRGAGRMLKNDLNDHSREVVVLPGEKPLQNKGIPPPA